MRVKFIFSSFLTIITVYNFSITSTTADNMLDISTLRTQYASGNSQMRLSAIESIASGKSEEKLALINNDVIDILSDAISDADVSVRSAALHVIHGIAYYSLLMSQAGTNSAEYVWAQQIRGTNASVDLANNYTIKNKLLHVLTEDDAEIKQLSVSILAIGYPPSSDIENAFVMSYEHEPVDDLRKHYIEGLTHHGYLSANTMSLLRKSLNDSYPPIRISASQYLLKVDPVNALPIIIDHLKIEKDEYVRQWYIKAIGDCGDNARSYLPELTDNLNRVQSDAEHKLLNDIIQRLNTSDLSHP